jgi:RHH-type rel operon transcriptional repressor/antitoxin RelB
MATSIRLDPQLEQRLDQLAQRTGRTKAYYC